MGFYKLFIGGISKKTNSNDLYKYFISYGEILDYAVIKNNNYHRGFGFVTFKYSESCDKVLKINDHKIKNKVVEIKIAKKIKINRKLESIDKSKIIDKKMIFVGGIPIGTTEKEINDYFKKYGEIVLIDLKISQNKINRKGYGFITFKSEKIAQLIFNDFSNHIIRGKWVEVKPLYKKNYKKLPSEKKNIRRNSESKFNKNLISLIQVQNYNNKSLKKAKKNFSTKNLKFSILNSSILNKKIENNLINKIFK